MTIPKNNDIVDIAVAAHACTKNMSEMNVQYGEDIMKYKHIIFNPL